MSWERMPGDEIIPGYTLIEPLGSGGFGEVWKCEAPGGLHKAIKFVYGSMESLDVDAVRAQQEFHAMERIREVRHPFVCSIERFETVGGFLIIVMELCDKTLHDLFQEQVSAGRIGVPRDDLLRYLRDAAEALDYMSEKHKLQHLDVKPRNLFLVGDRVKVADFGLVKVLEKRTGSGLLGGVTPLYAPPETLNNKISDKSDQYSLAIVYQELLTGHRPFAGKNVRVLVQQHLSGEPDLRALPEAERPIVARSLSKDPANRFPNCMAFVRALYNARAPITIRRTGSSDAQRPKGINDSLEFDLDNPAVGYGAPGEELGLAPAAVAAPPGEGGSDDHGAAGRQAADRLGEMSGASVLGITVPQPETGALRPTVFIGLGSFGRRALLELRCRFVDRFGDLSKIPLFRFLCIDSDPDALTTAVRGAPEVALAAHETYHLPLKPVSGYRKKLIDRLDDWLPREKLYAMPRSLTACGSRALGRLAFVDNHQRLVGRLRKEITSATHPDAIYQSVTETGLALRDETPRIYVLCSATGGSSGMLVDLGYALQRQLGQMRAHDAPVTLFLMCGAPTDPASPPPELANVHATLTEINHFSDPSVPFAAEYGVEGQRIVEDGNPFESVYLLPMKNRSPSAYDDIMSQLGNYLSHEVTTPLGLRVDAARKRAKDKRQEAKDKKSPGLDSSHTSLEYSSLNVLLRSFGTYSVWFPRGLLLRCAARLACRKVAGRWQEDDLLKAEGGRAKEEFQPAAFGLQPSARIQAICNEWITNPKLSLEALADQIEQQAAGEATFGFGADLLGSPMFAQAASPHSSEISSVREALTATLSTLEEQANLRLAAEDPASWTRGAIARVRDWVGGPEQPAATSGWSKTRIHRALIAAAEKVALGLTSGFAEVLGQAMSSPGARVSAAEDAIGYLEMFCNSQMEECDNRLDQARRKSSRAWEDLTSAADDCLSGGGGFSWLFARSNRRLLRIFAAKLGSYARQRFEEELILAVNHFYGAMIGILADQRRDLGFCRRRLRHVQENLDQVRQGDDEDLAATRQAAEVTVSNSGALSPDEYWEALRSSPCERVLLPEGEQDLERAAVRLLGRLDGAAWVELDKDLYDHVVAPQGGLYTACIKGGDLTRGLTLPLMEESIRLLEKHLPIMDVSQILAEEFGIPVENRSSEQGPANREKENPDHGQDSLLALSQPLDISSPLSEVVSRSQKAALQVAAADPELESAVRTYVQRSAGLIRASRQQELTYMLVPASGAGQGLARSLEACLPEFKYVKVPGQTDLMFCSDVGPLGATDLEKFFGPCGKAYTVSAPCLPSSPHSRFDITDWTPLDP
ncbi:MAG: tubulin-like doman-containing protein [Gemmataceae bacterium]